MNSELNIGVGIIGGGFIAAHHIMALFSMKGVRVEAVCDSNDKQLHQLMERYGIKKGYHDYHELIADPKIQVVHNCTPNHFHDEINQSVILAGKHIYSEKPLSMNSSNAKFLWKLAVNHKVAHGVNLQYRMNAAVQEMKARIAGQQMGELLYVRGCYLQESASRKNDYSLRQMPETSAARALADIGVHWADCMCCVLSKQIRAVYARMFTHYAQRTDPVTGSQIVIRSDDTTEVFMEFTDGTQGLALFSKCMPGHKNDLELTVSGSECEYTWKQEHCDHLYINHRDGGNEDMFMGFIGIEKSTRPYVTMPSGHVMGWQTGLNNAVQAFYDSIRSKSYLSEKVPYATFWDGYRQTEFIRACLASAESGKWIELEDDHDPGFVMHCDKL